MSTKTAVVPMDTPVINAVVSLTVLAAGLGSGANVVGVGPEIRDAD